MRQAYDSNTLLVTALAYVPTWSSTMLVVTPTDSLLVTNGSCDTDGFLNATKRVTRV